MTTTDLSEGGFGPNIWLVDEMYRKYLDAPTTVSDAWQEFFADYTPGLTANGPTGPAASEPAAEAAASVDSVPESWCQVGQIS